MVTLTCSAHGSEGCRRYCTMSWNWETKLFPTAQPAQKQETQYWGWSADPSPSPSSWSTQTEPVSNWGHSQPAQANSWSYNTSWTSGGSTSSESSWSYAPLQRGASYSFSTSPMQNWGDEARAVNWGDAPHFFGGNSWSNGSGSQLQKSIYTPQPWKSKKR